MKDVLGMGFRQLAIQINEYQFTGHTCQRHGISG
jgi:hypothetical protein